MVKRNKVMQKKHTFRDIQFSKLIVSLDIINCRCVMKTANGLRIGDCSWSIDKENKTMLISDFGIVEKYRGKGYGNFLARVMISLARLYHLDSISLTDGSTLTGFWQRLGFKDKAKSSDTVLIL